MRKKRRKRMMAMCTAAVGGIDNRLHQLRAPFSSSKFRAKLSALELEPKISSSLAQYRLGSASSWLRAEPATTLVNVLSREEREQHVWNNLCFICHKDRHMSKECLDRKHYKGGSSKGKYKGKYKKGKGFTKGCHI